MTAFNWSYSRLADYEKCPALYRYRHIEKLPEPKGDALTRGIAIHTKLEEYLQDKAPLGVEFARFKEYIDDVKAKPGLVVEDFWALDREWQSCAPKAAPAWWRGKLDAYWRDGKTAHVLDWKTGRIYDSNRDQMRLYAGVALARDAEVDTVEVELVYLDARESRAETYTRENLPGIRADYARRADKLENEKRWLPAVGMHCKWCAHAKSKGGPCSTG